MPSLVRPTKVEYRDAAGKRVPKGTSGANKVTVKASRWYAQGIPGHPPKRRFPLATDKAVARRLMNELVAKAERGETAAPDRSAGRRSLAEHLVEFERAMALGLATRSKAKKLPAPKQVFQTVQRIRDALAGCGFAAVGDLNAAAPAKLAAHLQARTRLAVTDGGLSPQTAVYVVRALGRFVWFLSAKSNVPVRPTLFDDVPMPDPATDRRHARREIAPDELARVLQAARTSAVDYRGMTGEDRFHAYLVGFATGFRAGELAVLTPECFELDAAAPAAILPARFTKNKKPARQPLPPGVAGQLRTYLAGKAAGQPIWPGPWRTKAAVMLRIDLAAAGVPAVVQTLDGPKHVDFHALRHSFLSSLAAAGCGIKELQTLARHSDPRLTLANYTHVRQESLKASVALLPLPDADRTADPLAALPRGELEAVARQAIASAVGLWTAFVGPLPVAPRVAPALAPDGDNGGSAGTPPRLRASA